MTKVKFDMPVGDLYRIFQQLRCCMGSDWRRWYFCGIFIEAVPAAGDQPNGLRFTACDGHRLGQIERPMAADVWTAMPANGETRGVIVGDAMVAWFLDSAWQHQSQCAIEISATSVSLAHDEWAIRSKPPAETFPDCRRVIPRDAPSVFTVEGRDFMLAVQRLSDWADGRFADDRFPDLTLAIADDCICMWLDDPRLPLEEVKCAWQRGQKQTEIRVSLNHRHLQAIAEYFPLPLEWEASCPLELHLNNPASPVLLRAADQPTAPLYVLLPRPAPTHAI